MAGGAGSDSVALAVGGVGDNNNNNGPILGRSDDWPVAWPGDSRPYFDYLLVVFSGDNQDARKKRDYMREVKITTMCTMTMVVGGRWWPVALYFQVFVCLLCALVGEKGDSACSCLELYWSRCFVTRCLICTNKAQGVCRVRLPVCFGWPVGLLLSGRRNCPRTRDVVLPLTLRWSHHITAVCIVTPSWGVSNDPSHVSVPGEF